LVSEFDSRMTQPVGHSVPWIAYAFAITAMTLPARAGAQLQTDARRAVGAHASEAIAPDIAAVWQQPPRRRSEGGRIALQFLAASAGAASGGIVSYLMLRDVGTTRVVGDAGYTRTGNVGYLVGSLAGATLGAHVVGTSMGARSPLWATAVGALIGTVPLVAIGVDEPYLPLMGIALGWIPPAAFSTGGFNVGEARRE
jgi:hypothetical protein